MPGPVLIPVVLSGGAGTRLWPVSREGHPKPFMKMADGESLLLKTYARAARLASSGEIVTVTNRDYLFMSGDEFALLADAAGCKARYILEPFGRNTAPAIALAAFHVAAEYGEEACMLVLAADHLIADEEAFAASVHLAAALAEEGLLVTFGIVPEGPETGYGYIEAGDRVGAGRRVRRFVEKPDAGTAAAYVASGEYFWNSGMFCFRAGRLLQELAEHAPEVFGEAKACWEEMLRQPRPGDEAFEIPAGAFGRVPGISIDYALMERSKNIAMVPAAIGWSDIGSWKAISQLVEPDGDGNRADGEAVFVETSNTFVSSRDRVVAAVGLQDLLIVDTPDALLVAHPDKAQEVKAVVGRLKENGHDAHKLHRTVSRPWGTYTVLEEGRGFKIKRIEVKPGASLSLQLHRHRSEHWVVVSGEADVVNGERSLRVQTNESTYIPAGHKHRLENPGAETLVMIEVQSGSYLGEDDIVRFEDRYGRN
ncbi:mannose-1-phosphate guanylyltransferase/mannose-6-phosphate isomerase [Chlorobium sp. N1]|uniref:mannose-1-phosphate guanylyltransferase/mannose-6-phosphate isomerase n=1 Tax=Chlorobium sp. N1 TaxID=2491138 RepID=UPI001A942C9D|nr:mannose-1-phosphate guanylyltransferase/mannose-6-phosphate isomerase [Chlorobium sp. N1]